MRVQRIDVAGRVARSSMHVQKDAERREQEEWRREWWLRVELHDLHYLTDEAN